MRRLQTTIANVEYDFSKDQWYKRSSFKVSNKIKNILNEGKTKNKHLSIFFLLNDMKIDLVSIINEATLFKVNIERKKQRVIKDEFLDVMKLYYTI